MTGVRHGRIVYRTISHRDKDGRVYWDCDCDCGGTTQLNSRCKTESCGCIAREILAERNAKRPLQNKNKYWRGCGLVPKRMFTTMRVGARNREIAFNITIEDTWRMFQQQGGRCALSGLPLRFSPKSRSKEGNASLDRIDNSRGYETDNIQWVHKHLNHMKRDFPEQHFIHLCKSVASYNT